MTIAALTATLELYRDPAMALREIPTLAMLTGEPSGIRERCERAAALLREAGIAADVVESAASAGGGAFPSIDIPSFAISPAGDAQTLEHRLRLADDAVVGRITDDRLLLDMRSVPPGDDDAFIAAVKSALA
jgi:L-seryl-tRNA(Ser) seleniumtransferase